jgi:hypothetical protein
VTDWVDWHRAYDDPTSSQARRLEVVRRRVRQALDLVSVPAPRLLSLCAGDGRDTIPVLADRRGSERVAVVLVEKDAALAQRATDAAAAAGLDDVEVRIGDAGEPRVFADALPVDVLLLCGIFGNITDDDIARLIAATPQLLHAGGLVIWTRGAFDHDLRPQVRAWFRAAGFEEIAFDGAPERYGVGLCRLADAPAVASGPLPTPLFTFVR